MKKQLQTTFRALGTVNTITVNGGDDSAALQQAQQRVLQLDDRLSVFKENSEISRINQAAGRAFVEVHSDTLELIRSSLLCSKRSEGAFDLSARPMVALWGTCKKENRIPSPQEIAAVKPLVHFKDIIVDETSSRVMLRNRNQALDLGGIAKGYAADEVRRILLEHGIEDALINLGGTVIAMGAPRMIGIQHPQKATGVPMGKLLVSDRALVTSGSYEQYFVCNGVRYHHILDPRTGFPAQSGLLGVTLIGESAMELDALSTAVFVLGIDRSLPLLEQHKIEAVFITQALDVLTTPALKGYFCLVHLEGMKRYENEEK